MQDYNPQSERVTQLDVGGGRSASLPRSLTVLRGNTLKSKPRTVPLDTIYIHDNAGPGIPTRAGGWFDSKGLSVHFFVHYDGTVIQHAPIEESTIHGGRYNGRSIGFELRNPHKPTRGHANGGFIKYKPHGKRWFPLYTDAQFRAAHDLISVLVTAIPTLPLEFPGQLDGGGYTYRKIGRHGPGIAAHAYDSPHSDGAVMAAYLGYRMVEGKSHAEALAAVVAATSVDGKIYTAEELPADAWSGKKKTGKQGGGGGGGKTPVTLPPKEEAPAENGARSRLRKWWGWVRENPLKLAGTLAGGSGLVAGGVVAARRAKG